MNDLVTLHDNKIVTTSQVIAEYFEKRHDNVLRAIEKLECSDSFNLLNFEEINYIDAMGRSQRSFEITKDGFMFLAMSFTGKKAAEWKEKFIEAFNAMAQKINQLQLENIRLMQLTIDRQRKDYLELKGEIGGDVVEYYTNELEGTKFLLGQKRRECTEKDAEIARLKAKPPKESTRRPRVPINEDVLKMFKKEILVPQSRKAEKALKGVRRWMKAMDYAGEITMNLYMDDLEDVNRMLMRAGERQ